jgi:hypothetical protein
MLRSVVTVEFGPLGRGEAASRAFVRLDGLVHEPHVVVEGGLLARGVPAVTKCCLL